MAPTAVDTGVVRAALLARREEVLAQLDTMTLKAVRRQLEHDLGLNKDGLKPFKDTISAGIDEVSRRARRRGSAARKGGDLAPPLRRRSSRSTPSRRRPSPLGARRHRARTRRQALGASAARWRQRGARLLRQRQQVRASPAGHASGWCQLRRARQHLFPPPPHTHACMRSRAAPVQQARGAAAQDLPAGHGRHPADRVPQQGRRRAGGGAGGAAGQARGQHARGCGSQLGAGTPQREGARVAH